MSSNKIAIWANGVQAKASKLELPKNLKDGMVAPGSAFSFYRAGMEGVPLIDPSSAFVRVYTDALRDKK